MTDRRTAAPASRHLFRGLCGGLVVLALLDLAGVPVVATLPLPALLLTVAALGWAAWLVTRRFAPPDPIDLQVLDAGMLTLAALAVLGLVLGTLGWLTFPALMLGSGLVAAAGGLVVARWGGGARAVKAQPAWEGIVAGLNAWTRPERWATLLLVGLAAFALAQAVFGRALRSPIGDSIAYHLPFAVEWLQQGDLGMPVPAAGDPSPPFYPLNSSIWIFWTLAPFESEILARFVQAPFLVLLALAAFRLAREIGSGSSTAIAAAVIAVTLPDVSRSASLPENDLIMAAPLVAATASLARLWREPTRWRLLMTAVPLGLVAGAKVIALPYAGLLALATAVVVILAWRSGRFARPWPALLIAAGVIALLGGYSYLRNAVVMGNPLYPSGYELLGREVLSGLYVMTSEWRRSHAFYPFDWHAFFLDSRRVFGFTVTCWVLPGMAIAGVALLVTLLRGGQWPGVLGAAASPARERIESVGLTSRRMNWPVLALWLWTVISLGIFWYIVPYHFSRFLYAPVVWGVILAAWGLSALLHLLPTHRGCQFVPLLALPIALLNTVNVPLNLSIRGTASYWIEGALVVGGTVAAIVLGSRLAARSLSQAAAAIAIGAALLASAVWPVYESAYEERRFDEWRWQIQGYSTVFEGWEWVHRETREQPATVAVAGTNEIYPLYGEGLDNRLVTIWHSGELATYDWGEPFQLFGEPDRDAWLAQVDRTGVDYIYMTQNVSFGGWPQERAWIEAAPERFTPVFQNEDVLVWEVQRAPSTRAQPERAAGDKADQAAADMD